LRSVEGDRKEETRRRPRQLRACLTSKTQLLHFTTSSSESKSKEETRRRQGKCTHWQEGNLTRPHIYGKCLRLAKRSTKFQIIKQKFQIPARERASRPRSQVAHADRPTPRVTPSTATARRSPGYRHAYKPGDQNALAPFETPQIARKSVRSHPKTRF